MYVPARRRGFSLIELVIVFIVLAIFGVVFAISARDVLDSNQDRMAEINAQTVVLVEQEFSQRYGTYTGLPSDLGTIDDVLVVDGPSTRPAEVSVTLGDDGSLGVASRRDADQCVLLRLNSLEVGGGVINVPVNPNRECVGASALADGVGAADGGVPTSKLF